MTIISQGKETKKEKEYFYKCSECNCQFLFKKTSFHNDYINCPWCGKVIRKEEAYEAIK